MLHFKWSTTAFNRIILRWGSSYPKFLNIWFTIGLYATVILLPVSILLLLYSIINNFIPSTKSEQPVLDTVIPGIDFPASELGYYSLVLLICSVFHELGHAIAAVKEDIHLGGVGFSCFFILPVAYVQISSERLMQLNPKRALRIICAGIWHNIVLSVGAYLVYISLPKLLSSCFAQGHGVSITYLSKHSPLLGPRGLQIGNVITEINNYRISDELSWYEALDKLKYIKTKVCVETDLIHSFDESVPLRLLPNNIYECCDQQKMGNACFENIDANDGVLEIPTHVCLPVRKVLESSKYFCNTKVKCPNQHHCISPILENQTNIFNVHIKGNSNVYYIGKADDFRKTVLISPFVPHFIFSSTTFPDILLKFLKYLVIFSLGLAIVNVIPCFYFDGEYIFRFLLELKLKNTNLENFVYPISVMCTIAGTIMLGLHFSYSLFLKLS